MKRSKFTVFALKYSFRSGKFDGRSESRKRRFQLEAKVFRVGNSKTKAASSTDSQLEKALKINDFFGIIRMINLINHNHIKREKNYAFAKNQVQKDLWLFRIVIFSLCDKSVFGGFQNLRVKY